MQVYLITMPDKYPDMKECLRNYQDIEPSLRISYSSCADVVITSHPQAVGGPIFKIKGIRDGQPFEEIVKVTRMSVWDSPTHL